MSIPPPHGMSEADYETIEAAVTETVRGRWFLAEFARRNRMAETRLLLDAMSRLEATVAAGQVTLPSTDPSIRLLVQRIKEIAASLGGVAGEMRAAGVADHLVDAVETQSRAVGGMMRAAAPSLAASPAEGALPARALAVAPPSSPERRLPRAALPPALGMRPASHAGDPRLVALAALDALPLAEKLAVFR